MFQASQGGYGVDYAAPATQAGFPGSYLNQSSQAGFSRYGTGNDFMSQVRTLILSIEYIDFLLSTRCGKMVGWWVTDKMGWIWLTW